MLRRIYISDLFDIYGSILTDKQQRYFEEYYFNNLSLAEISEDSGVSRNAIHKHIKDAEEKLENFEKQLNIYVKNKSIIKFSEKLEDKLKEELKELL